MRFKYLFYFHDNKLKYFKKKEIKTYQFSYDCLQYGKIINIEKFIKELKTFFKKEKIFNLISPTLDIIVPYNYYNTDQEILLMSLNSLGINKINFIFENTLYPNKNNVVILNVCETYLIKTIKNANEQKSLLYPFNLFKDKKELLTIIKNQNPKMTYLLFGPNKKIPEFVDILKTTSLTNVHYYNNYQTYLIDQYLKKITTGSRK